MFSVFTVARIIFVLATIAPWATTQEVVGTTAVQKLGGPKNNLSCYVCHTMIDGDSCSGEAPYRAIQCDDDQNFCMVRRFSYTLNGTATKTWSIERNCTKNCEQHCLTIGERTTKIYMCMSCCSISLCNVGSSAAMNKLVPHFKIMLSALCSIIHISYALSAMHH